MKSLVVGLVLALAAPAGAEKVDWGPYLDHGGPLPSNAGPRPKAEPKAKPAPTRPAKTAAQKPAAKPRAKARRK